MNKLLGSSQNSNTLALTVKGILIGLIPIILVVLNALGVKLGADALNNIILQITAIIAGITTLIGLIRKLYYFVKNLIKTLKK